MFVQIACPEVHDDVDEECRVAEHIENDPAFLMEVGAVESQFHRQNDEGGKKNSHHENIPHSPSNRNMVQIHYNSQAC